MVINFIETYSMSKGGQVVYYGKETAQHLNWRPLKKHTMDCGPNCFSLLKYSTWDTGNEMAKRTPYGIYTEAIRALLDEAYGPGHEWIPIDNYNQYGNTPTVQNGEPIVDGGHIETYLYQQEATIAFIGGEDKGHYFVVLREDGYQAIDAQTGTTTNLPDYIDDMFKIGYDPNTLVILSSPEPMHKSNQVTMEMVKRYFPLPKKSRKGSVKSLKSKSHSQKHHSKSTRQKNQTQNKGHKKKSEKKSQDIKT